MAGGAGGGSRAADELERVDLTRGVADPGHRRRHHRRYHRVDDPADAGGTQHGDDAGHPEDLRPAHEHLRYGTDGHFDDADRCTRRGAHRRRLAVAGPLGLIMAWVLIKVINRRAFGWQIDMSVAPDVLFSALLFAVVASLLAGIYPAFRAARSQPALAMREE